MSDRLNYWLIPESKEWMLDREKRVMKDGKTMFFLVEATDKTETKEQSIIDDFNFEVLNDLEDRKHDDGSYEISSVNLDHPVWDEIKEKKIENF